MSSAEVERRRNIQVGAFVVAGLLVAVGGFWLIGAQQRLFSQTFTVRTTFSDVSGLRAGAPVRLAGMDVGTVTAVVFADELAQKRVQVTLEIEDRYQERVRTDSVASIATQGVLGDKYIAVSVGSPNTEPILDGDSLVSVDPANMFDYLEVGAVVIDNLRSITHEIDVMIKGDEGDAVQKSLQDIFASIRNIVVETEQGRGILHDLIYDPSKSQRLDSLLTNLEQSSGYLRDVSQQIRDGSGTLHSLVYEDDIGNAITSIEGAAQAIETLAVDARNENGLLNALLYDQDRIKLIENLEAASADLRAVASGIREGEGTIGGLISDPTIYQDLKTLLGRAERNRILKAYVRQTLEENERASGLEPGGAKVDE